MLLYILIFVLPLVSVEVKSETPLLPEPAVPPPNTSYCDFGSVRLTFISQSAGPVIDTLTTPGTEDNAFGFEGGRAIKQNGRYYYFAAEMFAQPLDANMRVALWSAGSAEGPWRREGTIQQSNQSYPLVSFTQQCNQPYCAWKGAVRNRFVMQMVYDCDPNDLLASPWAPFPIFCEAENVWHVLYVSYMCDGTWFVAVGGGNIFGARSTVKGRSGIAGPYETYGIVIGPNATSSHHRWGNISHASGRYVDQLAPFELPDGRFAAFVAEDHLLATADSPSGPWTVEESSAMAGLAAIGTNTSVYNENPVVSRVQLRGHSSSTSDTEEVAYVAVFDTVYLLRRIPAGHVSCLSGLVLLSLWLNRTLNHGSRYSEHYGFGVSTSRDGLHWSKGVDVPLPGGCRTPLGIIDEGDGFATMLFTRRYTDCANRTELPPNGADAILPTSCGNVHVAKFRVTLV